MKDLIRQFIEESCLIEFDDAFDEHGDLFKEGVMDSFGYIQLVRFLEREFKFTFSEEEMSSNILVNLASIHAFVLRKVTNRAAA